MHAVGRPTHLINRATPILEHIDTPHSTRTTKKRGKHINYMHTVPVHVAGNIVRLGNAPYRT